MAPQMPDPLMIPTLPPAGAMRIPAQLEGLQRLAYNLYWTWHPSIRLLFSRVDSRAWVRYRNPIPVLQGFRDWADLVDIQLVYDCALQCDLEPGSSDVIQSHSFHGHEVADPSVRVLFIRNTVQLKEHSM